MNSDDDVRQKTGSTHGMTDLEGVVVEFEFADRILEGRVTSCRQEADIARGPVSVFNVDVPGAGTYDVVEDDIRAT